MFRVFWKENRDGFVVRFACRDIFVWIEIKKKMDHVIWSIITREISYENCFQNNFDIARIIF